jgi:hypothetical protein
MKERAKFKKHDPILVAYDIKTYKLYVKLLEKFTFLGMFALMKDSHYLHNTQ